MLQADIYNLNACKLWYSAKEAAFPNQHMHQRHANQNSIAVPFLLFRSIACRPHVVEHLAKVSVLSCVVKPLHISIRAVASITLLSTTPWYATGRRPSTIDLVLTIGPGARESWHRDLRAPGSILNTKSIALGRLSRTCGRSHNIPIEAVLKHIFRPAIRRPIDRGARSCARNIRNRSDRYCSNAQV